MNESTEVTPEETISDGSWTTETITYLLTNLDDLKVIAMYIIGGLFTLIGMFVILLFVVAIKK